MAGARFWREKSSRYNGLGSKCGVCQKVFFPPRIVCDNCGRPSIPQMKPLQLKGMGTVHTFSVVHDPPRGFETQIPYVVGMVAMDEGCNLMAQIVDCDPKSVHIGMRVKDVFRKVREDGKSGVIHYAYKFAPLASPHGGATSEHPEALAAAASTPMEGAKKRKR
jgi:scaffold protein (connect acetoacetyl-CoA thiolase and HMG-CoA synthase)